MGLTGGCSECGYSASTEGARAGSPEEPSDKGEKPGKMEDVMTPGLSTVQEVSAFLKVKPSDLIKTLIYTVDGEPVAVLIRGDHEANETKIKKHLKAKTNELADEAGVHK